MSSAGLEAFVRLAREHRVVPVVRAVIADLETPVAAFWKLRRGTASFLLESVEGGEKYARYTFIGTEPHRILTTHGTLLRTEVPGHPEFTEEVVVEAPLGALGAVLDRYRDVSIARGIDGDGNDVPLPRFYGGLVGAVSYDAVRAVEKIPDRHRGSADRAPPDLIFMETRQVLVWDNLKHRAMLVHLARIDDPTRAASLWLEVEAALDAAEQRLAGSLPPLPVSPDAAPSEVYSAIDDKTYAAMVERAREYIAAGDIIQVVLSRRFLQARRGLHPFLVYRALRALNPSPYMFYLELGERTLVGASPELLVRRTESTRAVEVRPIAGTRPRGATPAEDAQLCEDLKNDPKEIAEHVMLLDLGRNDVGRISEPGSVQIDDVMVFEKYSHVTHLVSHVRGTLRADVGPAETLAATFPAGTLSGAPKIRAMQIIDQLETSRRGFYGGAVGTIGIDGNVDLAIAIRTLIADDSTFAVQAGAGIVWDSVGQSEADESRNKASAVLTAIDQARRVFVRTHGRGA